nr:glycosyltransferase family 4 protein [Actinomadura sp. WMMA1423]
MPIRLHRGGAVERRMIELARAQAAAGHEVQVFSGEDTAARRTADGVRYEAVKLRLPRPYRDYEFLVGVHGRLGGQRPDIIHAHNAPEIGRLSKRLRVPAVYSFDYFRLAATRWALGRTHYRRSLAAYSTLLPVSAACGREFSEFWAPSPGPMTVFYNGVNLDQFRPDPDAAFRTKEKHGLLGSTVVLYVGRVCEQKGADLLLDAWESVRREHPTATLVFAGPIGQFTGSASESPLTLRLRSMEGVYLGAVPDEELNAVYNMCDVFAMPTRQDEMFGMAALEAQACGKPVVASRLGGLSESVGEASGEFFTPGDRVELAAALRALLESPERRIRMGSAALEHARRFCWTRLARRSLDIYGSALSAADGRAPGRRPA